jgi:hypothetical protein
MLLFVLNVKYSSDGFKLSDPYRSGMVQCTSLDGRKREEIYFTGLDGFNCTYGNKLLYFKYVPICTTVFKSVNIEYMVSSLDFYSNWVVQNHCNTEAFATLELVYPSDNEHNANLQTELRRTLYSGFHYELRCTVVYFLFLPGLEISFRYKDGSISTPFATGNINYGVDYTRRSKLNYPLVL